jgi:hypothetical protein
VAASSVSASVFTGERERERAREKIGGGEGDSEVLGELIPSSRSSAAACILARAMASGVLCNDTELLQLLRKTTTAGGGLGRGWLWQGFG